MKKASRVLTILMASMMMVASFTTSTFAATAKIKIKSYNYPTSINVGRSYTVKGTITSTKKINRIEIGIVNKANNKWTAYKYDNKKVNAKSFNIKKAASKLKFNKLPAGSYYYRIYVHVKGQKVKTLLNKSFTVTEPAKATLSGCTMPSALTKGDAFTVKGTISCTKNMSRVEVGIVNSAGKWTAHKYDSKINTSKFDLCTASSKLDFSKLDTDTYYYRIYAHTPDGVRTLLNHKFTVISAPPTNPKQDNSCDDNQDNSETVNRTIGDNNQTNSTTEKGEGTVNGDSTGDRVVLSENNYPGTYNIGTKFSPKGTITCNNTINRVEIGIVVKATNKWTEYKYDNTSVNAKSFDISKAASCLAFDKLPGGDFWYRIYIHTNNGATTVFNKTFTVIPNDKPQRAVKWAINIANDDRYTYGKGGQSMNLRWFHCPICYGCTKTSDLKYTCMPFLAAAYAHGTGDPVLMAGKKHVMNLHDGNFKGDLGDAWFKVGLCKDLDISDLQIGDVVVKWSDTNDSGHVWMYAGGDMLVEAVPSDIRVISGAAKKLKKYGTSEGLTSKNYVMRYKKP